MIYDVQGIPTPPTDIVDRLHRIDPQLNLRFIDYQMGESGGKWWALTWEWPSNDPRMRLVDEKVLAPGDTFDILGHLPLDCGIDQAAAYVEKNLKSKAGSHSEVNRLLDRMHNFNDNVQKKVKEETLALAEELVKVNAPTLFAKEGKTTTRVYMPSKPRK